MFRWRGGWWKEAGLAALFALITLAAARGWTADLDLAVRDLCRDIQVTAVHWLMRALNILGQGGIVGRIVPIVLTALLWWRTRRWQVVLPWLVGSLLTYATLGPLKIWSMRASPNSALPDAVEFFNEADRAAGYGMGYPSGHVVNSIVWWAIIALLAGRLWRVPTTWLKIMRIAPPIIVVCTTTYLGHHWLTDGLGAVVLGLLLVQLVNRFRWDEIIPP